jgi:type III secretion protein C
VTPMIVDDRTHDASGASAQSVMMSLDIQDGNIVPNQSVSNVPVIQQRNIVTKTMIDEGKSLLIAGFNNDQVQLNKSGVPWLSDIPLIGSLFKYTDKNGQHTERFYLLTPRIVSNATMYAPDGSPVNPSFDSVPDASGLAMYRAPDNDSIVPLAPKPLPGTLLGAPLPPPPPPPRDPAVEAPKPIAGPPNANEHP